MAVALATAVFVPVAAAPPAAVAAGRPGGPLVPATGFYVGAYTKPVDGYGQDRQQQAVNDLESRLGRRLHIDHTFYSWNDAFPSWRESWDIENERIPMISWNGENTDSIARGDWDGLVTARAQAVAQLGSPVFIRWFWEMDGNKKQGFISSPASYQKAWRHIHDIFVAAGATNAVWVWCPNASGLAGGGAQGYWPGASYVDWTCGDGYNFAPNRPGDQWETFAQIYTDFYTAATKLGKPIMIGEFGVLERKPGEKEQWFRQAHDWVTSHPAVAAIVYFNADSAANGINYNWRIDTSPSAFEGFRYLFTGPAPVMPDPSSVAAARAATPDPEPANEVPAPATPPPSRPPTVASPPPSGPAEAGAIPATASRSSAGRAPSSRLTWMLELLRQLDAAAVAS
jgi:hypothetical protein